MTKKLQTCIIVAFAAVALGFLTTNSFAQSQLLVVSADIVEISGSLQTQRGFTWNQILDFTESEVPGVFTIGEFNRTTLLNTTLKLLENEGKAQILNNPRIVVNDMQQGSFAVGGEIPIPVTGAQGSVGADYKKFGVVFNVVPTILPGKDEKINVQLQLEVSSPDYSKPVTVQNSTIPSLVTRQIQTVVDLKSGETIVIGGLKNSYRNVNVSRVPLLGKIPLLGALFSFRDVVEEQRSLFLFVTVEKVK
jgi:Flp pilus assembly secretin CpaC